MFHNLYSNWVIQKYQSLCKKDGYPFTVLDSTVLFEMVTPCNFGDETNNLYAMLVDVNETEMKKYMSVGARDCYKMFIDQDCETINCGGAMVNKLIDLVYEANAQFYYLKQGAKDEEQCPLKEVQM